MMQPSQAKRPSPLSVRLNNAEWQRLREMAGSTPISAYVKGVVFDTRCNNPAVSQLALARALALLGSAELAANMAEIAAAARSGSIFDDDSTLRAVNQACTDIRAIRQLLLRALGKRAEVTE